MSAITLFGSAFSGAGRIAEKVASETGYRLVNDRELVEAAEKKYGIGRSRLEKALCRRPCVLRPSRSQKAHAVGALMNVLSEYVEKEPCIFLGNAGYLLPRRISLRVLVAARDESRLLRAMEGTDRSDAGARHRICGEDRRWYRWLRYLKERGGRRLGTYDLVIPSDRLPQNAAVAEIIAALKEKPAFGGPQFIEAADDLALSAKVSLVLARKGHDVAVEARKRRVTLVVNRHVAFLSALERKLTKLALSVLEVDHVKVRVGRRYYRANICCGYRYRVSPEDVRAGYEKEHAALYRAAGRKFGRRMMAA